eukprot:gb/GECG01012685.1/.p1 GENE.gb/GECG01012685.1/~~gb/GECG01012685.1/.p1  ORF type:complete len:728 (+),score=98.16 gb/GECG01012685.1/:1-2184(+)
MDPLTEVVEEVMQRSQRVVGFSPGRVFTAYLVRTMVYHHEDRYSFQRPMDFDAQHELVEECLEALEERNDPALETLRMQVEFDSEYYKQQGIVENNQFERGEKLRDLTEELSRVPPRQQGTALPYKVTSYMYQLLEEFIEVHTGKAASTGDAARKEITTALESVFPQTGLNAFLHLTREDKDAQLHELAHLVLGIRLFNWDIGKGGAGVTNILGEALAEVSSSRSEVAQELDAAEEMAQQYGDVLRALDLRDALQAWPDSAFEASNNQRAYSALHDIREGLEEIRVASNKRARWIRELYNRRQLASYLNTLHEELSNYENQIKNCVAEFRRELSDTKQIVGGKASVPKEKVYPKFNSLARVWLEASDIAQTVYARSHVKECLKAFLSPAVCTLHLNTVRQTRSLLSKVGSNHQLQLRTVESAIALFEHFIQNIEEGSGEESKETAEVLNVSQNPEYMQLPLEFQGFCPVSLLGLPYGDEYAPHNGALIPGNPHFGVARFKDGHIVCSNDLSLARFSKTPTVFMNTVKERARKFPELIHLLGLQKDFAAASLPALIHSGGRMTQADAEAVAKGSELGATGPEAFAEVSDKPPKADAATSTPVHFIEKSIQPNYTWNEWELRRRALKMAKIRGCVTHGTQTDNSHFKRDNSSQVYLPREQGTQTGIERGTNPTRTVRYLTGLRGNRHVPVPAEPEASEEEKKKRSAENVQAMKTNAKFVSVTYDTTELK